jgi:hypothetical protein
MNTEHHSPTGFRFWHHCPEALITDTERRARRRRLAPTVVGAAALAVLGGLGVVLGSTTHAGLTPRQIAVSVVATTSTSAGPLVGQRSLPAQQAHAAAQLSSAQQQLVGLLPPGYGANACQSVTPPVTGGVATVDCFNNSAPGGPTAARYSLFSDQPTMDGSFQRTLAEVTAQPCPGGGTSPGTWNFSGTPTQAAGSIVCGAVTDPTSAAVAWTDDANLLEGVAEGPDVSSLYNWWANPPAAGPQSQRVTAPRP